MNKAVFYKEWLKTRWFFLAAGIIFLCYTLYLVIRIGNAIEIRGADHLWPILLTRDTIFIEPIRYLPLFTGLLIGIVQFIPEVIQKRMKLTLHLPYPRKKMVSMMMVAGLCELLPLFIFQLVFLGVFLQQHLATELTWHILLTALPWYAAGITAYIWTYATCMEPTWKMRAVLVLAGTGIIRIHFMSNYPESYNCFLPFLLLYGILGILLIMRSMIRFKEGCQD